MKIRDLKILNFGEKTNGGRVFDKDDFVFSKDKEYLGYLNFEASQVGFKDACAFMVDNLKIEDNYLIGDVNIINAPAVELMNWIGEFEIFATTLGCEDEEGIISKAELVSFVAEPVSKV